MLPVLQPYSTDVSFPAATFSWVLFVFVSRRRQRDVLCSRLCLYRPRSVVRYSRAAERLSLSTTAEDSCPVLQRSPPNQLCQRDACCYTTAIGKKSWQKAASQVGGGEIFHGRKLMWYQPAGSNAVGSSSRADAVTDIFAPCIIAVTHNAFQRAGQPRKLPLPLERSEPLFYTWFRFFSPPESTVQSTSRSVRPFLQGSRTWPTDRKTHRHTDTPHYSVCSNRPHLSIAAMRPNNTHGTERKPSFQAQHSS